jgi:hypothetical protein
MLLFHSVFRLTHIMKNTLTSNSQHSSVIIMTMLWAGWSGQEKTFSASPNCPSSFWVGTRFLSLGVKWSGHDLIQCWVEELVEVYFCLLPTYAFMAWTGTMLPFHLHFADISSDRRYLQFRYTVISYKWATCMGLCPIIPVPFHWAHFVYS